MARSDGRKNDQLREISITTGFQQSADGSVLIRWGNTWVLCAATVEEKVPPFRMDSGEGWTTAEYAMLPGSTNPRKARRSGGREKEIQRLIGRSLRAAIDLKKLGSRTISIDCDVISADGGTRVASITGGWIALALTVKKLRSQGLIEESPLKAPVAAVSVGIIDGEPRLDLPYEEDSRAEVDMNIVMNAEAQMIEVQGTAEEGTFSRDELNALCDLAEAGIKTLNQIQNKALESAIDGKEVLVTL